MRLFLCHFLHRWLVWEVWNLAYKPYLLDGTGPCTIVSAKLQWLFIPFSNYEINIIFFFYKNHKNQNVILVSNFFFFLDRVQRFFFFYKNHENRNVFLQFFNVFFYRNLWKRLEPQWHFGPKKKLRPKWHFGSYDFCKINSNHVGFIKKLF